MSYVFLAIIVQSAAIYWIFRMLGLGQNHISFMIQTILLCSGMLFSAYVWIITWGITMMLATMLTILHFMLEHHRHHDLALRMSTIAYVVSTIITFLVW